MDPYPFHVGLFSEMGVEAVVETGKISVAMPACNGEKYLRDQLDSILMNLGQEDEVVISDDGSTDRTLEIIREYQSRDSRVRLVAGPGQGIKKNVEHALKECVGEYIFLADQDDVWMPDKVQKVMNVFETSKSHLVIHDARVIQAEDLEKVLYPSFMELRGSGAGVWKNIIKNSYIGCCMAFRAELKELVLPIPKDIEMHDQWIGIWNDHHYGDTVFIREPLIYYRRHGQNNSKMTHYGIMRMLRNRIVFCWRFLGRIFIIHKRKALSS